MKRKSTALGDRPNAKVLRSSWSPQLTSLPLEILDNIMLKVVPDVWDLYLSLAPLSYGSIIEPDVASTLFTSPVLQTCRLLRERGLRRLSRNHAWIFIDTPDYAWEANKAVFGRISALPPEHSIHLTTDTPRVSVFFDDHASADDYPGLTGELVTNIVPFNFDALLRLWDLLSGINVDQGRVNLSLHLPNVSGSLQKSLRVLIGSSRSCLRFVDDFGFTSTTEYWSQSLDDRVGPGNISELSREAEHVLQDTNKLESMGLVEEAYLLLIYSGWIRDQAEQYLPDPEHWRMGEYHPSQIRHIPLPVNFGRSPEGNQLRRLVFQIEHKATLAYAHFRDRYGPKWMYVHIHPLGSDARWDVEDRFLKMPDFKWIGLTVNELAMWHHGLGLMHGVLFKETIRNRSCNVYAECDPRAIAMDHAKNAMMELGFVCLLDPKNKVVRAVRKRYNSVISLDVVHAIEKSVLSDFVLISGRRSDTERDKVIWAGDKNMLMNHYWIGRDVLEQVLPLAQRGLDAFTSIEDWLPSLSKHQTKLSLWHGRYYEKVALHRKLAFKRHKDHLGGFTGALEWFNHFKSGKHIVCYQKVAVGS